MRISDWSSDVCSSDLTPRAVASEQIFARDLPRIAGRDILDDEANAGLANARKPCAQTKAHLARGTRRHPLAQRRLEMWLPKADKIGRASWRESGWQYVSISVVAVSLQKKTYIQQTTKQ